MSLTPFLLFDGNCAEAMAFYESCLGSELLVTRVGDTPMKGQMSPEQQNSLLPFAASRRIGQLELTAVICGCSRRLALLALSQ